MAFYIFWYLYIEIVDFFMSFQHQPPRNPIKDLSQPTPVETYLDLLLLAIQASDEPLKFLTESRVTRVWMVKEVKGIHHEYTLVKVCFNSNSETHYFRIERTHGAKSQQTIEELLASNDPELIEIGNDFKGLCAPPSETTSTLSVNSAEPASEMSPMTSTLPVNNAEPASGTSLSVSPVQEPPHVAHPSSLNTPKSLLGKTPHPANDTISFLNSLDPPHPDVTLHDIHPENLTWLQFILIVNLVHSEDRIYSVIGNQCYWFSQLIFLLTRAKFCPAATKEPAPSNDSTVPVHISRRLSCPDLDHQYLKLERSKNGMAPGSWMSVQATRIEIFLLNKLQSMFDFRWHEIRQNVCTS